MALYCGIDLHSRDSWLAVLDEGLKVVQEAKGKWCQALTYDLVARLARA